MSLLPDLFEQFWHLYPRKVAKGAARMAWKAALRKTPADRIVSRLQSQIDTGIFERMKADARSRGMQEKQLIAHPATWLNGERWDDEAEGSPAVTTIAPKFERIPDWLLTRMMENCGYMPSASIRDYIVKCGNEIPERARR